MPFHSVAQEQAMFIHAPEVAKRWQAQFGNAPGWPGGHQPYAEGNQHPGAALNAMTKGAPGFLPNPMDARRGAQKAAGGGLLGMLF